MSLAITKHINITLKLKDNICISITSPKIGCAIPRSMIIVQGEANMLFFLSLIQYRLSPVLTLKLKSSMYLTINIKIIINNLHFLSCYKMDLFFLFKDRYRNIVSFTLYV